MTTDDDEPDHATAHAALAEAISAYYAAVAPDIYVDAWVLVTHKRSPELEQESTSAVGLLAGNDTSWLARRALLDVALQLERDGLRS